MRRHGASELVHLGYQGRDATEKLVAWGTLVELNVRSSQALVHDIHDLRDDVVDFIVLDYMINMCCMVLRVDTHVRVDILENSIKPDKSLWQILLQCLRNNSTSRKGKQW